MSEAAEDGASDPVEWFSLVSTISIAIGIVLIAFGLLVPTNYAFDADLPARQMESIEIFYFRLSEGLVICLIVGMALVTLGGVIQTGIILHMYRNGELDPQPTRASGGNTGNEMTALWQVPSGGRNYGTRDRRPGDPGVSRARDGIPNDAANMAVQHGHEGASNSGGVSESQYQQQPR